MSGEGCREPRLVIADVRRVAGHATPWAEISPDAFADILPHNFDGGSRSPGEPNRPCSGSMELVRHDRVIAGTPECLLLALFAEQKIDGACSESLNAMIVRQTFASRGAAEHMARALFSEIAPHESWDPAGPNGVHYWENFPLPGQETRAEIDVSRVENGWHVYLWFSRGPASD
ncbi:MAG TPA: hypothetical protein VGQ76_07745 [Thermoanaerobaculia bacterium]|nr:hypothetical protein [Thermoanaerobaculia bacterium]